MRCRTERGQALPLMLVIMAAAVGAMLLLGGLGRRAVEGAQAQTAADAAALAAAAEGPPAAEELARLNGSTPADVEGTVGDATVTVRVGGADAVARAQSPPPPAGGGTVGLAPDMVAAVTRAGALLGEPVPISSGWRSRAQQAALWARRSTNPYPVARPGTSMHERGLAIDVHRAFVARLRLVATAAGLCQPLPSADPVHFELCRRTLVTSLA
ncbi:MAG TPA: M15 family metallopeptidase, partial [Acidimicrobiales bacterium]|nr:M15 family metallopeptidase [Acidimicrobiales bacterium]